MHMEGSLNVPPLVTAWEQQKGTAQQAMRQKRLQCLLVEFHLILSHCIITLHLQSLADALTFHSCHKLQCTCEHLPCPVSVSRMTHEHQVPMRPKKSMSASHDACVI